MHYLGPMNEFCCYNIKKDLGVHNWDCYAFHGPRYKNATMAVTFTDGQTIIYKNVRVCINKRDDDGIVVDGTTVKFEAADTCFTVVGVRQYVYEIEDTLND